MAQYIDPDKFAAALISTKNFEASKNSVSPGKVNVDKALKLYVEAIEKANKFNDEYSKSAEQQKSQDTLDALDVLNNIKF
ncbi:hypothetical protein [Mammaliicoccus sciuri]|uniref:hypothetical protein n=1 Tax=Mammaliicoccus sciuri TaxID=1296 RepID=UPI0027379B1C|nr:hypothetical protein [Mammaliicoccus sciuri]MDT0753976.1 hypothetical protein [Mammaliicoccus sciuri]MEB6231437.1 hypothetical protein [Mammaliicoccus sciuri]